jgi:hypothetical protein
MLRYEDQRTQDIVARLVRTANTIRTIMIFIWAILLGIAFSLLPVLMGSDMWWLGGILGLLLGYGLGQYLAAWMTVMIEWMAQLLVSQGEIIALLRKQD